ncbi:hypothetical protein Zmor_023765 [Zophobas morio]|uniref:Uncharacterized protein n=1 Tax=Zophobas morio TaxID=2755281 RepID=A0AA38I0I4_9CUCU|nr:hypothetical protein Zmor_023765 [Zophobas morio]
MIGSLSRFSNPIQSRFDLKRAHTSSIVSKKAAMMRRGQRSYTGRTPALKPHELARNHPIHHPHSWFLSQLHDEKFTKSAVSTIISLMVNKIFLLKCP